MNALIEAMKLCKLLKEIEGRLGPNVHDQHLRRILGNAMIVVVKASCTCQVGREVESQDAETREHIIAMNV